MRMTDLIAKKRDGFPLETGGIKVADVDSTIAKYQEELDAAGYQDVLKEFQNQYTKWKG